MVVAAEAVRVGVRRAHVQTVPRQAAYVVVWENAAMACILLDVDGVLHVSGEPIPRAVAAVGRLRSHGHSLRFVTNNSTRPRQTLAEELRELGFELDDDELQTTPRAAARELAGKRVLALVMGAIVPDLEELDLVGDR